MIHESRRPRQAKIASPQLARATQLPGPAAARNAAVVPLRGYYVHAVAGILKNREARGWTAAQRKPEALPRRRIASRKKKGSAAWRTLMK
jgi:hypothetical protein